MKRPADMVTDGTPPPTARAVKEWIGKSPDSKIPPHVRLRVFDRFDGRDYDTGRKIRPGEAWDADHLLALCLGGENRESNLVPRLKDRHKAKTAEDVAKKSKSYKTRARHVGVDRKQSRWRRKADFTPTPTKYVDQED